MVLNFLGKYGTSFFFILYNEPTDSVHTGLTQRQLVDGIKFFRKIYLIFFILYNELTDSVHTGLTQRQLVDDIKFFRKIYLIFFYFVQ